jgi:hypothetical protein
MIRIAGTILICIKLDTPTRLGKKAFVFRQDPGYCAI